MIDLPRSIDRWRGHLCLTLLRRMEDSSSLVVFPAIAMEEGGREGALPRELGLKGKHSARRQASPLLLLIALQASDILHFPTKPVSRCSSVVRFNLSLLRFSHIAFHNHAHKAVLSCAREVIMRVLHDT